MPFRGYFHRAQGHDAYGRRVAPAAVVVRSSFRRRRRRPPRRARVNYNRRVPRGVGSYRGECVIRKLRFAINDGAMFNLESTTGGLASPKVYRANDLFDPYSTGAGSQPRCFDQLMAMYRHFCVLGSKIVTVWSYGVGSSTSNNMTCSITLKDGATAIADSKAIIEHPRSKYNMLSAESDKLSLVHKYSWRINSIVNPTSEAGLWGTASASPTDQWYYHLNAFSPNGGTENAWVTGYIEYTAIFFHAIQPAAS